MLALVGAVMLRSASEKVLLRDGDGVLDTHKGAPGGPEPGRARILVGVGGR
jgi:hypothetical protein